MVDDKLLVHAGDLGEEVDGKRIAEDRRRRDDLGALRRQPRHTGGHNLVHGVRDVAALSFEHVARQLADEERVAVGAAVD
jgi:hypothetical protein